MVSSGTSTGKPHTSRASLGKPHLRQLEAPPSDDIINISSDSMSVMGIDLERDTDSDDGGLTSAEKEGVSNSPVVPSLTSSRGQPLLTAAFI